MVIWTITSWSVTGPTAVVSNWNPIGRAEPCSVLRRYGAWIFSENLKIVLMSIGRAIYRYLMMRYFSLMASKNFHIIVTALLRRTRRTRLCYLRARIIFSSSSVVNSRSFLKVTDHEWKRRWLCQQGKDPNRLLNQEWCFFIFGKHGQCLPMFAKDGEGLSGSTTSARCISTSPWRNPRCHLRLKKMADKDKNTWRRESSSTWIDAVRGLLPMSYIHS